MYTSEELKGTNGVTRTNTLFYELCYSNPENALFTTKEDDIEVRGKTYVSLRKLYVAMVPNDPTEYEFAQVVFGSWEIWQNIAKSSKVKPLVEKWRREVEVKVKSEAIKAIAEEMRSNGRSSFTAAKLLLDKGWLEKEPASAAKKQLKEKEEAEQDQEALAMLSMDAERLGLKVN